ncbi:hypothetical protein [uncultured Ilyobacter sp.]|uniref:hypothetical protein n=1 Tax=uncultured Ilyobacter sp. TaxID=544433 RepID=UPI0029F54428|nr:hypothetical protein [uncultured Ilyobacter sp.]
MKKKGTVLAVLILVVLGLFTGCSGKKEEAGGEKAAGPVFVTIATGGSSGAYFAFGRGHIKSA